LWKFPVNEACRPRLWREKSKTKQFSAAFAAKINSLRVFACQFELFSSFPYHFLEEIKSKFKVETGRKFTTFHSIM